MTNPATDKTMHRKIAASSPRLTAWAVLGAVGLGYLGIAFFTPRLLPDLSGGLQRATETTVMEVFADVNSLKLSLTKLELDVTSVRAEVSAQASQMQQISSQLAALGDEVRLAQTPAVVTTTSVNTQAQTGTDAGASKDADAGPLPVKVVNALPRVAATTETGSVNKAKTASKPILFWPAIVKPVPRPVGIQLATDPSVDGLRVTWGVLSQIHPKQLSHLKARYADPGMATNPNFDLIAGPIRSKTEARKLCKELAAQSVNCKVSEYRGAQL